MKKVWKPIMSYNNSLTVWPSDLFSQFEMSLTTYSLQVWPSLYIELIQTNLIQIRSVEINKTNLFFCLSLPRLFCGMPVAGHGKFLAGFCRRKTANLIDSGSYFYVQTFCDFVILQFWQGL